MRRPPVQSLWGPTPPQPQRGLVAGLGGLPFGLPAPRTVQPCGPGLEGACAQAPAQPPPLTPEQEALLAALRRTVLHVQPSPLTEPPLNATIPAIQARKVIAPPTSPGSSSGAAAALAIAHAEGALAGTDLSVLTPATTSEPVEVLTHEVPKGQALVVHGIGAWGHDYLASRDLIRWRISARTVLSQERELGLVGSLDAPARVFGVLREGEVLKVEARNLDALSPSLVQVVVLAWQFPVQGSEDSLEALLDRNARAVADCS